MTKYRKTIKTKDKCDKIQIDKIQNNDISTPDQRSKI